MKLKQASKDALVVITFYLIIIVGVVVLNTRFDYLNNQQKSAECECTQTAQNQ